MTTAFSGVFQDNIIVFWPFCWLLVWALDSALAVVPGAAVVVPVLVVVVAPEVVCVYVVLTVAPVPEDVLGLSKLMTSGSILVPVLEQYSVKDFVDLQI